MSDGECTERDELANHDETLSTIYDRIVSTALRRMDADIGSVQALDRSENELRLLSTQGFSEEAQRHWANVGPHCHSACGLALATGKRFAIEDVETSRELVGTRDLELYRAHDIRSVVSTPLRARGHVMGMVTVHWKRVHLPTAEGLRQLDELAREAAELIEWRQREEALRANSERLAFLLAVSDALRQQTDLDSLARVACRLVGKHFEGDRATIGDIDEKRGVVVVRPDWTSAEQPSIAGTHPREAFVDLAAQLLMGQPIIIDDTRKSPYLTAAGRATLVTTNTIAIIAVPVTTNGACWFLTVSSMTPRRWTTDEIMLLHEAAERIHAGERRLRAEEGLRTREELLEITFDSSLVGRFIWDIVSGSLEVDDDLRELLGLAPGEPATARHLGARVHPDDIEQHRRNVAAALDPAGTGTLRSVSRVHCPDGTVRRVGCYGRVLFDGEPRRAVRLLGTLLPRDEEELVERRIERQAADLVSRAGLVEVDRERRITLVTSRFAEMLGFDRDELVGKSVDDITPPADIEASLDSMRRVTGGESNYAFTKHYVRKDGTPIFVRCTTNARRTSDGTVLGYIGIVVEI